MTLPLGCKAPVLAWGLGLDNLTVEVDGPEVENGEASGLPHFDAGAKALPGFSRARSFAF